MATSCIELFLRQKVVLLHRETFTADWLRAGNSCATALWMILLHESTSFLFALRKWHRTYPNSLLKLTWTQWRHMATHIWVNTGSCNGLLPDGTKPLAKPMLTYHSRGSEALRKPFSQEMLRISNHKIGLKNTFLKTMDPGEQISEIFESKCNKFHSRKCISSRRLQNSGHFASISVW